MKSRIRTFISFLIVISVLITCQFNAFAASDNNDDAGYIINYNNEFEAINVDAFSVKITKCLSKKSEIIIPETIDGKQVVEVGGFNGLKIKNVLLPENVSKISHSAFYNCTALEKINLENVEIIENSAFKNNISLKSVNLESIISIGRYSFSNCKSLTDIKIGSSISDVSEFAFYNSAPYLKAVSDKKKALYIDRCLIKAFTERIKGKFKVKKNTVLIADNCFVRSNKQKRNRIKSVIIPDSVKVIGNNAFQTESIKKVVMPKKLVRIGKNSFNDKYIKKYATKKLGCYYVGKCLVASDRYSLKLKIVKGTYIIADGALYGILNKKLIIPNTVKYIGEGAISGCQRLKSIKIPASVILINKNNFNNYTGLIETSCKNLVTVNVDKNNKYYSSENGVLFNKNKTELIVYPNNKAENSYTVPSTVKSIKAHAFSFANNLKELKLNNGLETIENYACSNCKLISITIPNSVNYIGRCAFGYNYYWDEDTNGYFPLKDFTVYGKKGGNAEKYCQDKIITYNYDDGTVRLLNQLVFKEVI